MAGSFAIGAKVPIMFATSANNDQYSSGRMIITADGKTGLGIASPTQMMDISNASGTGSQLSLEIMELVLVRLMEQDLDIMVVALKYGTLSLLILDCNKQYRKS